jgi:hypothetical protein
MKEMKMDRKRIHTKIDMWQEKIRKKRYTILYIRKLGRQIILTDKELKIFIKYLIKLRDKKDGN